MAEAAVGHVKKASSSSSLAAAAAAVAAASSGASHLVGWRFCCSVFVFLADPVKKK